MGSATLMAGGIGLVGVAGYVVLALAGNTLPPADVAAVASVYLLVNIVGPGVFLAVEQETSRAVANRIAHGEGTAPTVQSAAAVGLGLLGAVVTVLLATSPLLVPRVLGGSWVLFGALLLGATAACGVFLVRGVFGGRRRFGNYAATLAFEGLARILPCLLIAGLGVASASGYGYAFAAGSGVAALLTLPQLRRGGTGPAEPAAKLARGVGLLGSATLLSLTVANLAPVVVNGRLPQEPVTAAAFAQAFVLVRVPLLVYGPIQAMLLPGMTAAAVRGELQLVATRLRQIMALVVSVGTAGAVGSALLGPWVLTVLFGVPVPPPRTVLGLLGLSTILLMVALVLQPALVALGRHRTVTISWMAGTAILVALTMLPLYPVTAAVIAQLVGSSLVVLLCAAGLRSALHRPPAPVGTDTARTSSR